MPAGIVLAGGRSARMGRPKAWLDWHGSTLLRRVCGLVARGVSGPVVVVRAPGQALPPLPPEIRVVDDEREGRGPLQGLLAGLEAVDEAEAIAFVAATDVPFLHPRFVAAVCRAAAEPGVDAAVPFLAGRRQPLLAAYRTALLPLVAELVAADRMRSGLLVERCAARLLEALPHPESARNVNTPEEYEEALAEPPPRVRVRVRSSGRTPAELRAATLGAAAAGAGVVLDGKVVAALNGDDVAADPAEPLAEGDEVAFTAG
jgi:molybdenum cofactor guanylyltransferase